MRNALQWRKMTWTMLVAVALAVLWVIASGYSLVFIGVSLAVIGLLLLLWYFTEPLWRQGRGAQLGRRQAPVVAFKPVKSLVEARDPNSRP